MMFSKVVIGLGCLFVGRAAATNFPIVLEQPELSDPAAKLASFLGGGNGRELTVHQSQQERKLFNIVAQGERKLYNIVAEGEFPCTPSPLEFRFEFTLTAGTEYTIDVIPDQEQCILFPIAYIYLNGGLQATSFNAFRRCGGIGDPFFLFVPPTTATYVIRVGVYFQQVLEILVRDSLFRSFHIHNVRLPQLTQQIPLLSLLKGHQVPMPLMEN